MSPTRYASYLTVPGLVACAALLAGCLSPEAHSVFQPDWERQLRAAHDARPDLPPAPTPRTADPADWIAVKLDAQGPLELSIEEAVVMAMRHNRDLQVQQLTPVITGTFEQIERGVFDPELFAELTYGESTASEIDRGTGQQFSVDDSESQAIVGVRQQLPSGTDVELSIGQNRDTSNRAPEQQDARLGLTVTQQLLRGAGPAVNLARLEQAKLDTAASMYVLRGFAEALLAQVETTYWQHVLAAERITIFERSRDIALTQLDVVEKRVAVGALARTELAAPRAEVARREQALIDARSDLEAQRLRLLRLIDATPDDGLPREVRVSTRPQIEPEPLNDLREHLRLARGSRNDLAEARLRLEQDRLETIVTRNGVLPRLEVFAALGKTGYADTFGNSFSELDGETYDLAAGVRLSHLLGNDAAEARNQAAYASRRQSAAAIENLEQLVDLDVRLAANELERARQQITASATTRSLQEETVRAEQERFEVGASTTLLVAQAQRDLLEAQIAEVEAIVAYRLALIDLYLAEGSLLDRRGFVID
ncbi:TolC family protein [Phycisphaeraceae bacterium D3-23]